MSINMKRGLNKFADVLEILANLIIYAIDLVVTDATWGKAKYRKRARQPRAPRQPRLYVVDKRK